MRRDDVEAHSGYGALGDDMIFARRYGLWHNIFERWLLYISSAAWRSSNIIHDSHDRIDHVRCDDMACVRFGVNADSDVRRGDEPSVEMLCLWRNLIRSMQMGNDITNLW